MQEPTAGVRRQPLATVGAFPAQGRLNGRAAGREDRVGVSGPVIAPVIAAGAVEAGGDVTRLCHSPMKRAAERSLKASVDLVPGRGEVVATRQPRERHGGAQADGRRHVVAVM